MLIFLPHPLTVNGCRTNNYKHISKYFLDTHRVPHALYSLKIIQWTKKQTDKCIFSGHPQSNGNWVSFYLFNIVLGNVE